MPESTIVTGKLVDHSLDGQVEASVVGFETVCQKREELNRSSFGFG